MENKQEELNNNLIEYIKHKKPSLINTTDFTGVSVLFINKTINKLNKEIAIIAKDTCKPYNKIWIAKQQEIRQVLVVQDIVRKIAQYLLNIDNGNKETELYKKVKALNSKCDLLLDIIDPM